MFRCVAEERNDWRDKADEFGFKFHTMYGEPYWDESAYYQFTLKQIEQDLEAPTEDIHQLCLSAVDRVVRDEFLLQKFCIPPPFWDLILESWLAKEPSLYSRLDLAYDGQGAAKLYENNADTPTSLYETGFWQWLWLEDKVNLSELSLQSDQFNSLQEKLVDRFIELGYEYSGQVLYFSCCKDSDEDRGTVQYLEDCANEAGIVTEFIYIEDMGHGQGELYTDLDDRVITWMFKLYPWEFMFRETYGEVLPAAGVSWIEPPWKAILSNKALLPLLWELYPNHPNLLPAYFDEAEARAHLSNYVKKPIFSREGSNVSVYLKGKQVKSSQGSYGEEGFIFQAYHPLPKFSENFTLIGSWLVNDKAAGISVREDKNIITQNLSRYLPHVILG